LSPSNSRDADLRE
jgi:general stress protein 26